MILVQGDTNTVLAAAIAATKLHILVGHIEAGLRSYDRRMPEEMNRILTDHCSDFLFAPTEKAKNILLGEGISESSIFVTGNTIVDAIWQNLKMANIGHITVRDVDIEPQKYFLVTLHRPENVDNPSRFASIIKGLEKVAKQYNLPIIYPVHPRSRKMMQDFGLSPQKLRIIEPVDFFRVS